MNYPSDKEIEIASKEQLGRWCRFIINPRTEEERDKINLIFKKFLTVGGWDSTLSKKVGWNPHKPTGNLYKSDF